MTKPYFIALTGAKKNIGDFLITDRALKLLNKIAPEYEYILHPHWKKIENTDFINNSEGIIILGGPGFQQNMYPGVYKFVNNIEDIKVPIHTLGVGWKGTPGDSTTEKLYQFTESSMRLLKKMDNTSAGMSCRDYQTERTLTNNGFKNITMTGCPVWYDLPSIGKSFSPPKSIKRIVYTPAQNSMFFEQSIEVLKFLQKKYPEAEILVSFHRGIGEVDEFTPKEDAENTKALAEQSQKLGAKVVDVSYDLSKMDFYQECDLHIGYRVHAHIYFLSKRLPSILLHEDGRGNGVSEALQSPGVDAYRLSWFYSKIFNVANKNARLLSLYKKAAYRVEQNITAQLHNTLLVLEATKFEKFKEVTAYIDNHYQVMEKFIKNVTKKER